MSLKKIVKAIYCIVVKLIPKNDLGDRVFSLIHFVKSYHRFPNDQQLFSNYLFKIKHNTEGHNSLRAYISDKVFVKNYVTAKVGIHFNVPTLAVLEHFEEAKSFNFPSRCCIKPTHLSGKVILQEDSEEIDLSVIKKWFRTNQYEIGREKNYRFLKPKIIVEPLIFNKTNNEDFKFFCYGGKAKFVQIDIDRRIKHSRLYFDREWNEQEFCIKKPKAEKKIDKPKNFDSMLKLADCLSKDFEFIRVDLYTNGNEIYVGELTNWPENGNGYFVPRKSEIIASRLLFNNV